jgi:hypothetical protein
VASFDRESVNAKAVANLVDFGTNTGFATIGGKLDIPSLPKEPS